jgi:hypothetical protein
MRPSVKEELPGESRKMPIDGIASTHPDECACCENVRAQHGVLSAWITPPFTEVSQDRPLFICC